MIEIHPFGNFVPKKAKFLLLGSFTGRPEPGYDWFYSSKRNQFWPILEKVYGQNLKIKKQKQQLFTDLHLALADIILKCERKRGDNSDTNLTIIEYNISSLKNLFKTHQIKKIYFSSRYVEKTFRKFFKDVSAELVTLPSPSPRFAAMTRAEKIKRYKTLLPQLP